MHKPVIPKHFFERKTLPTFPLFLSEHAYVVLLLGVPVIWILFLDLKCFAIGLDTTLWRYYVLPRHYEDVNVCLQDTATLSPGGFSHHRCAASNNKVKGALGMRLNILESLCWHFERQIRRGKNWFAGCCPWLKNVCPKLSTISRLTCSGLEMWL